MNCIKVDCNGATKVTQTRGNWRRRQCLTCGHRFSTIEAVADEQKPAKATPPRRSTGAKVVPIRQHEEDAGETHEERDALDRLFGEGGFIKRGGNRE